MTRRVCACSAVYDTDSPEKKAVGGKFSECPACSTETTHKVSGVMIYDHKTAPSLQINDGTPEGLALTEFMNRGARGQRSSPPSTSGAVVRVADVGQSRRGDVPVMSKPEPTSAATPFANIPSWKPATAPLPDRNLQAVWYDAKEKKVYRVMNGNLYEAEIECALQFVQVKSGTILPRLTRQKGLLLEALRSIEALLTRR